MESARKGMSRREILFAMPIGFFAGRSVVATNAIPAPEGGLTIGVITDLHFAVKPTVGTRHYADSEAKLESALRFFKDARVDVILQLGDLVDQGAKAQELEWLGRIAGVFERSGIPWHSVLGNHDLATLSKQDFFGAIGQPERLPHHAFVLKDRLFLLLDANFLADGTPYEAGNFQWTDTWLPDAQQHWIRSVLAEHAPREAIVFVHQNLDCEEDAHGVKNAPAVRRILEQSGRVRAVFQGHQHSGGLRTINGIPYHTLRATVEGPLSAAERYACVIRWDRNWAMTWGP